MEWVISHMEDPDFNDPLPDPMDVQPGPAVSVAPRPSPAFDPSQVRQ